MHKVYYIVVSPRFFRFRVEELGEGERRWSRHDTGGDEGGRVDAEVDVGGQHVASDLREAAWDTICHITPLNFICGSNG